MQYLGGKSRIARRIVETILLDGPIPIWVEPFCGACSVSAAAAQHADLLFLSDARLAMVTFWQHVLRGWRPPETVTEEEYRRVRAANEDRDPLTAFCAAGCSFGGKWWGGYARNAQGENYALASARSTMRKQVALCGKSLVRCLPFEAVAPPNAAVIYCDPPYANTTGYGIDFDGVLFARTLQRWADAGHRVYVSEYVAPTATAQLVADFDKTQGLRTSSRPTEKLFRVTPT